MRQREQIEGDLIQMTALLHDLALCGIGAANLNEVRRLTEAVNILIREAGMYCPQVIQFPHTGGEPLRERARLEGAAGC